MGKGEAAIRLAEEALASPNSDTDTSAYAGYTIAFMGGDADRGVALVEDATVQCPSFAWAWASMALLEVYFRSPELAQTLTDRFLMRRPEFRLSE